jgi:hypothetical protein
MLSTPSHPNVARILRSLIGALIVRYGGKNGRPVPETEFLVFEIPFSTSATQPLIAP